jgi:NO-binding membrane sensor protein with MHYT domain
VKNRTFAILQLMLAGAAAAGGVLTWLAAGSLELVAPIIAGEPQKSTVVYDPGLIALALILATVAGVLAVAGIVRLRTT